MPTSSQREAPWQAAPNNESALAVRARFDAGAYELLKQQKTAPEGLSFQFYWSDDERYHVSKQVLRLLKEGKLDFNADETFTDMRNEH